MAEKNDRNLKKASYLRQAAEILENINDGFFALDRNWRFIYINKRAASNLGLKPEDIVGQNIWGKFAKITGTEQETCYRKAMQGGKLQECEIRGAITGRWYYVRAYPSKEGISVFWQDITGRKETEEALRQREERFRVLTENLHSAVALIDEQGHFVTVNSSFLRMFGFSRESTILNVNSRDWSAWKVYQEDGKTILDVDEHPVREASRTGKAVRDKLVGVRLPSGGELIWMTINAEPILKEDGTIQYLIATYHDITERKKAEEALKESEQRHRSLFENMIDGYAYCQMVFEKGQPQDFVYKEVNKSFERLTGLKDVIGKKVTEVIPGIKETNPEVFQIYGRVASTGQPERFETYLDQLKIWLSISVYSSEQGTFTAVFENITERKNSEEALRRYTSELESANKELEAFSYSVSHDLKAPLRTLNGFSQAIIEDYGDKLDASGKDYLIRIRDASQLMARLIDDMLKLSRISRTEMQWDSVNLSQMVKSILGELKSFQPEREAEFIITPNLIADGDRSLLQILFRNLLENAWKFTGKCPKTIIEFNASEQNGEKTYFIKDNGAGFDMKYADKLFQPFQRLHSSKEYPGEGIGLATAQRIIRRHGGQVRVESSVGLGTTFYFTLK